MNKWKKPWLIHVHELIGKLSRGLPMLVPAFDVRKKKKKKMPRKIPAWSGSSDLVTHITAVFVVRANIISYLECQANTDTLSPKRVVLNLTQLEIDSGIHRSFAAHILMHVRAHEHTFCTRPNNSLSHRGPMENVQCGR